jgi:hypothetical protein
MTNIFSAALELQQFLESRRWPFCIICGVAALHLGEPRVTRHVDITLFTGFGSEEKFIHELLGRYKSRINDPIPFALRNRVLLLLAPGEIGLDIALGALAFEEAAVSRAHKVEVAQGIFLRLCTAEDHIIFKTFAARPLDWRDVEGIISRQGVDQLDWIYIERQLHPLAEAKEQPELLNELRELRAKINAEIGNP